MLFTDIFNLFCSIQFIQIVNTKNSLLKEKKFFLIRQLFLVFCVFSRYELYWVKKSQKQKKCLLSENVLRNKNILW